MTIQDVYPAEKDKDELRKRLAAAGFVVVDFRLPVLGDLYVPCSSNTAGIDLISSDPCCLSWVHTATLNQCPRLIVRRVENPGDKLDQFWGE
jgi:hypothetical protein